MNLLVEHQSGKSKSLKTRGIHQDTDIATIAASRVINPSATCGPVISAPTDTAQNTKLAPRKHPSTKITLSRSIVSPHHFVYSYSLLWLLLLHLQPKHYSVFLLVVKIVPLLSGCCLLFVHHLLIYL